MGRGYVRLCWQTIAQWPNTNVHDNVEKTGREPEMHARVDVFAITPTVAVVRVDMEQDANGADYTDFQLLLKQDWRWVDIAKVFYQYG